MATYTAQLLAGDGHLNDDGILPQATLTLSENSRPAWLLSVHPDRIRRPNARPEPRRVWIPSCPERILEEGLWMLALHVWRLPAVRRQAWDTLGPGFRQPRQDLTGIDSGLLEQLCEDARGTPCHGKLAVMVLRGSTLLSQLPALEYWPLDAEVCTPRWWRIHNQWSSTPRIGGSLDALSLGGH